MNQYAVSLPFSGAGYLVSSCPESKKGTYPGIREFLNPRVLTAYGQGIVAGRDSSDHISCLQSVRTGVFKVANTSG